MLQGTETECWLPGETSPTRPCVVAPLCRHGHVSIHVVCVSVHGNSFIYVVLGVIILTLNYILKVMEREGGREGGSGGVGEGVRQGGIREGGREGGREGRERCVRER